MKKAFAKIILALMSLLVCFGLGYREYLYTGNWLVFLIPFGVVAVIVLVVWCLHTLV